MITISTSELRRFIAASKNIKSSNLLPIYSYIKLVCKKGGVVFYKSNGRSFIKCTVDAECEKEQVLLIDEKVLFSAALFTGAPSVTISLSGNRVIISDGKKPVECQLVPDNFQVIQEVEDKGVTIDSDMLEALSMAKDHVGNPSDREMRHWTSLAHVVTYDKITYISGFNGFTSYTKMFKKKKYPELHLDTEVVSVISQYDSVEYASVGNYDYFWNNGILYGFIKTEIKCPDLSLAVSNFKSNDKFTIDRASIVKFCESVIYMNDSSIKPEIFITDNGENGVTLNFKGISGNQSAKEDMEVKDKTFEVPKLYFQPNYMISLLKGLDMDEVTFLYTNHNLISTSIDDKDYVGSIMEIAHQ